MKRLVALVLGLSSACVVAVPARGADAHCTVIATRSLVHRFAVEYSAGRVAATNNLWAPEPRFYWFSTSAPGRRLGSAAYRRSTLVSYFRARAGMHERLRVIELRAGYDPARELVHFSGKLVRTADDTRSRTLDFKGAADCVSGDPRLIVWSM